MSNFIKQIEDLLGTTASSGYRSPEEQEALHRAGKTRLAGGQSAHNHGSPDNPGALDFPGLRNQAEVDAAAEKLRNAGYPVGQAIYETGKGRNQGTGAHGHIAFVSAGNKSNAATPVRQALAGLDKGRTDLPTGTDEFTSPIVNPEIARDNVKEQYAVTDQQTRDYADMVGQAATDAQGLAVSRTARLAKHNEDAGRINDAILEETKHFQEDTAPLLAEQQRIADRRAKVAKTPWIVRDILGIFDPNWDEDHLKGVQDAVSTQIAARGQAFESVTKLQQTILNTIDKDYNDDDAMSQLLQGNLDKKIQFGGLALQAQNSVLGKIVEGINLNSSQIQAENVNRAQLLDNLTPGQIETGLNAAKSGGGTTTIQGVTISEAQLMDQRDKFNARDLAWKQSQLAFQMQQQNADEAAKRMSEEADRKFLGTLSASTLASIAANGGKYNGRQFDIPTVGAILQSTQQTAQLAAGQVDQQSAGQYVSQSAAVIANQNAVVMGRARQLFGSVPESYTRMTEAHAQRLNMLAGKLRGLPPGDAKNAVLAEMAQEMDSMRGEQAKAVDKLVTDYAGNNKAMIPLARAWMTGAPLNSSDAATGIISMVRSGTQIPGSMSPAAQSAIAAAREIIKKNDNPSGQAGVTPGAMFADKPNAKKQEQQLVTQVAETLGNQMQSAFALDAIRRAPMIAKSIGHIGQKLDSAQLGQADAYGTDKGFQVAANQLGLTVEETKHLFAKGPPAANDPLWVKANKPKGFEDPNRAAGTVQIMQLQSMYQYMDANMPKIGGYKPSQVYANLLSDPRYAAKGEELSRMSTFRGFGDYVMGAMTANTTAGQLENYGSAARIAQVTLDQKTQAARIAKSQRYGSDPELRMKVTLSTMMSGKDATLLTKGLMAALRNQGGGTATDIGLEGLGQVLTGSSPVADFNQSQWGGMTRIMQSTKFADPQLERLRKAAVSGWDAAQQTVDQVMKAYHGDDE